MEFDSRARALGGGVDIEFETINFTKPHNLANGNTSFTTKMDMIQSPLVYLVIPHKQTGTLVSGDEYVARFVNTSAITLHKNDADAAAGIIPLVFLQQLLPVVFINSEHFLKRI